MKSLSLNLGPSKGHTGDRQWQLGSHAAAHYKQNLDHVFSAYHV